MMALVGLSISRMPGPPLRPFVADHDDVPGDHLAVEDGLRAPLPPIEDARRPVNRRPFLAGDLGHRAVGREVAVQDHQMAVGLDRIGRTDERCPGPRG